MFHTEDELLTELAACGFDFYSNLSEIAAKFPPVPNWGYENQLVIHYPLTRPYAGLTTDFKISVHDDLCLRRPATYWYAEFHPTMDWKENFEIALAHLTPLIGPGTPSHASNTQDREWDIGCFRLRIITWPRELNSGFTNVYEGKNPYLWISTNIYVESRLPRIARTESYDLNTVKSTCLLPDLTFRARVAHYSYRNSLALEQALGDYDSYCFLDSTHLRILTKETTVVIPREEIEAVEHGVARPARGGGYSEIALHTVPSGSKPYRFEIHSNHSSRSSKPDAAALAKALRVPLKEAEWLDE